ncbi:MAG: hypothetical protein HDT37_05865 [Clostridiales bacterium]|nr:hypothetical protein [Clostridiales bacterium]
MFDYHQPIHTSERFTLSIDKMVIDYRLSDLNTVTALGQLLDMLPIRFAVSTKHWESYKIGSFRENFTITFQNNDSFWIGVILNCSTTEYSRVRLEINPNKCASHNSFLSVLGFLNQHSRPMHTAIKRFDLAVDIAVERESARLIKDGRVYSARKHGKEWTEYLGQTSHIGRVKLYNKAAEAKLPIPLTRLEVTLDPATPFDKLPWPKAYYIRSQQVSMAEVNITDTERYILSALLAGHGNTKDLCRKTREKMERLLNQYVQYITISKTDYDLVQAHLRAFLAYPANDLDLGRLDSDQPPTPRPPLPAWVDEAAHLPSDAVLP